jgi:hypothetical protein
MGDLDARPPPSPPGPRETPPPPGEDGAEGRERARRARRLSWLLQAGGIAFLAVVALGLLPTILSASSPVLGTRAAVAVLILAPAIPIALLAVAALRLRRWMSGEDRPDAP